MDNKTGTIIIPRHSVTLRFIELPSTDKTELKNMVEFQALKELPYPKEEMITSYRNLGSYKKGYSSLMLSMIRSQVIKDMLRMMKDKPEHIRLETEIMYLALMKKGIVGHDKTSLVINVKDDYSEIMVVDKKLIFSRAFKNTSAIKEEIGRSIASYKRDKANREIEHAVIIYSGQADIGQLTSYIKSYLNVAVSFYEHKDDFLNLEMDLEIDFLPKEYVEKKISMENKKEALLTYFFILMALMTLTLALTGKVHKKNTTLKTISNQIINVQEKVDMLSGLVKKIDIMKSQKEDGELILNILKGSYDLIPGDISLTSMDYDGRMFISYKGTTLDTSGVFNFIKVLENSGYFKNAEVKYATKKEVQGQVVTDFNIVCQIYTVK